MSGKIIIFSLTEKNYKAYEFVENELSISYMPDKQIPEASHILQRGSDKLVGSVQKFPDGINISMMAPLRGNL